MASDAVPVSHAPLLEVTGLAKHYPVGRTLFGKPRRWLRAVDGISFAVGRGQTIGVVGESGCGKSTLGRLLIGTVAPTLGEIRFEGRDLARLDGDELRPLRRRFQMVFQDPFGSLDPRMAIVDSVAEPLLIAGIGDRRERRARALEMLEFVGITADRGNSFPHEFSGGQRQRICIARALVPRPHFIVADEPVSALDVSVRAQVINLFEDIQARFGVTYLFISHDLGIVRHVADVVAVMYLGRIVEIGAGRAVLDSPLHPYTQALRAAIPPARPRRGAHRAVVVGDLPSPLDPPAGCRFHPRCPLAIDRCRIEEPKLLPAYPGRQVACHRV